jgi:hypothetical protein
MYEFSAETAVMETTASIRAEFKGEMLADPLPVTKVEVNGQQISVANEKIQICIKMDVKMNT